MKVRMSELRRIIRQVLLEISTGGSVGTDPTNLDTSPKGFYPYDVERGVDIYSKWYKSPGEKTGDPGRPDDAAGYIGMVPEEPEAAGGGEASSG